SRIHFDGHDIARSLSPAPLSNHICTTISEHDSPQDALALPDLRTVRPTSSNSFWQISTALRSRPRQVCPFLERSKALLRQASDAPAEPRLQSFQPSKGLYHPRPSATTALNKWG